MPLRGQFVGGIGRHLLHSKRGTFLAPRSADWGEAFVHARQAESLGAS